MKKTLSRSLSLLLAIVLAVSLALPAAAASVAVTGVTLDKTTLTLAPKDSYTLKATVKPDNATNQNLTWKSNRPDVATVSSKGVVTAVSEGTASILVTTNDGGYFASCDVTVAKSKVTSLTIDPAGPEVLPIGKTRTLIAKGNYSNGTTGTVDVSWSSNDNAVATVDKKGVVTAVAEGTTTIFALYREGEDNNSAVSATYQVTVSKSASTSKDDVLTLAATTVNTNAGLFVESAVKAPAVTVKNGTTDVTEAYNITYLWTDASKKELGKDATLLLQPTTQADLLLTCTVTAASKTMNLLTVPLESVGTAMATYAGQNLGASRMDRVRQGVNSAMLIILIYGVASAFVLHFTDVQIMSLFLDTAKEVDIVAMGREYLFWNSVFFVPLGALIIWRYTIQGLGFSSLAMLAGVAEMVARTAVAIVLVPILGYFGAELSNPAAWIAACLFLYPAYRWTCRQLDNRLLTARLHIQGDHAETVL